jgi:DNA-binding PadR family transcriptional regulator
MPLTDIFSLMSQQQEERKQQLEQWVGPFLEEGINLAALAVLRRGEVNASEAAKNIADFTADVMSVDEARLASELQALAEGGYVELHDGHYRITISGKQHMFLLLKQWNRYLCVLCGLKQFPVLPIAGIEIA